MPSEMNIGDKALIQRLIKENEQLLAQNRELNNTVVRLELFNKINERQIEDLKAHHAREIDFQADQKRRHDSGKWQKGVMYVLLLVVLLLGAFYLLYNSKSNGTVPISREPAPAGQPIDDRTSVEESPDTSVISRRVVPTVQEVKKSVKQRRESSSAQAANPPANGKRYKVVSKAYFHNEPDEDTRRAAFITHWNNAVITPINETGDFIYIVFTNHLGQTSRGWLRKDELIELKG